MNGHANRGKFLEEEIIKQNNTYFLQEMGLVFKRKTNAFKSKDAFNKTKIRLIASKPDFYGFLIKSNNNICYVDFDVKESGITNFRLNRITPIQLQHLERVNAFGGFCPVFAFFLIYFRKFKECYFLPINVLKKFKVKFQNKSIPYTFFKNNANLLLIKNGFDYYDYLYKKQFDLSGLVFKIDWGDCNM